MKYKKYRGANFQEARLKMILDLGSSGYILSHRQVRKPGILGFFRSKEVEITVAHVEKTKKPMMNQNENQKRKSSYMDIERSLLEDQKIKEIKSLKDEINNIKTILNQKSSQSDTKNTLKELNNADKENSFLDKTKKDFPLIKEENLKKIQKVLKEDEFDDEFIYIISSLSSIQGILSKKLNLDEIKKFLKKEIIQILKVKKGINFSKKGNVVFAVGPTGVGKTTTLAKLGAYFGVFEKRKVQFLSLDTYRVGAIQHIEFYANIMNVPFKKIHHPSQFQKEIEKEDYDIILVDTAGRSQKNTQQISEIEKYTKLVPKAKLNITLVVSATTKYKDLLEIFDQFDVLSYQHLIITKLDETNTMGPVLSAARLKNTSLTYVTFGQTVPEDIQVASKNRLLENILK